MVLKKETKGLGAFTLSLDCEGLWGMADQPKLLASGAINARSLETAYKTISMILDRSGIRATAAFVSAFASPKDAVQECLPLLDQLNVFQPGWFAHVLPILQRGHSLDGWEGHVLWRQLADAGHEMAWHGATHMPLLDTTHPDAVDLELQLAKRLFLALEHAPTSVVFPRNQVGHLDSLRKAGFDTYRASAGGGGLKRVGSVLREWNVWDKGVDSKPQIKDGWCVTPAGFFLNWPAGIRSVIPVGATVSRWRSILRSAVAHGGYVHMWFHPHNLITAPAMHETFAQIMHEVGSLVRSGDLLNPTMAEAKLYWGETETHEPTSIN